MMEHLPALVVAVPLLAAFATQILDHIGKPARNAFVFLSFGLTFLLSLALAQAVLATGIITYVFGATALLPSGYEVPIRIIFEADALSALFLVTSSLIAFLAFIYSIAFKKITEERAKFDTLFLLMTAGMLGLVMTGDLFNMFIFLEILSISAAALIAYSTKDGRPAEAAFKFIVISALAALMVLFATAILYGQYDALNLAYLAKVMKFTMLDKIAMLVLVAALAMKAGAVPLHYWVSDAYGEAPGMISAVMVVVSQASLYALFRVCFSLFGLASLGWVLIIMGVLSMFVGVTMALVQKDIKRLMAFHAISQTGYMFLGVGVGLAVLGTPALAAYGMQAIEGGLFHVLNHALYKGLLFLTASAIFLRIGLKNLDKMGGLAKKMPITTIFFIIGALAIAGLPPFNGFASKLLIYESVYFFNPILSAIAMLVSVLTLASFVKVFHTVFLGPEKFTKIKEVPKPMLFAMGVMALLIILLGLFPEIALQYIVHPAAQALVSQSSYMGVLP